MVFDYLKILSCVCLFIIGMCFILYQLWFQKHQLHALIKENKRLLALNNQLQGNPLGRLFEQNAKSLLISLKTDGKITAVNEALLELLHYTKRQLVGKNIYGTLMPIPSSHEPLEMNIVKRIIKNPKLYTEHETELSTKNGEKIWVSWTNRILTDKSGKPIELHSVGFDITPRKKMEEELQFIASKDPQTGVFNRLSLMEIGTRELKRAIRYQHPFSVLALRLISTEATLPSLEVEKLLKRVVSLCRHTIRDVDYLGRVGEAEFVLLLPETEVQNVPFLQNRLQAKVDEYNQKTPSHPIRVSFGTSAYVKSTRSIDDLISKALSNIKKGKIK